MSTDVASFARQLKEEGIEAARKEAEAVILRARSEADEILREGREAVAKMRQEALEEIARQRQRAEAELKLVARDLVLSVKEQVERIAAMLLKEKAAQSLSNPDVVKDALMALIKCQETGKAWELALGPSVGKSLAETIVHDFSTSDAARLKLADGFHKVGFQLKAAGGNEVIEVSDESVADAFRRLLSLELQKLLDGAAETAARR